MSIQDWARAAADAAAHAASRALAALPVGTREHWCCLCDRHVRRFLPYRQGSETLRSAIAALDLVGSDITNFECPACGCHDRERHLALYMRALGLFNAVRGARVLHFAPELHLRAAISDAQPADHVLADLHPATPGIRKLDLMAIDFPAGSFDLVIANHVLEHVDDDVRALHELLRVLRPGGLAILQTPFSGRLASRFEDRSIVTGGARLRAYGQEDHVRLYGVDLPAFVASLGFVDRTGTHATLLPDVDGRRAGVNVREPFFLFAKPQAAS